MTQAELAGRAGINANTVSTSKPGVTLASRMLCGWQWRLAEPRNSRACSCPSSIALRTYGATRAAPAVFGQRGKRAMLEQVNVFYEGWGERWQWGSLVSTTALTGRPLIVFEYSVEARRRGLELCSYTLPLQGPPLRREFPRHQLHLPGPVYDALPDGWGCC